jgi:hypothetical protein
VDGRHDLELDAVDRQPVAGLDLLDRPQLELRRELAEPLRDDDRGLAGDLAQGRRVEVVVVAVADEHGVEVGEQLRQHGPDLAAHRAQPLAQHGVGEDPEVVDLDQDGRVPEERQPGVGRACVLRRGPRTDGAPVGVDGGVSVRHGPMVRDPRPARQRPGVAVAPSRGMPHLDHVPPDDDQPPPRPGSGPLSPPPPWSPLPPTAPKPPEDREVKRARERAERAARRADRAEQKVREAEGRAAVRRSSAGDIVQAAGDAASAALTAVSAAADEATERWVAKQRLNALDQALTTARAGGRVDIAPPTRKEALALADRIAPSSTAASFVRGAGMISAGIVALAMLSIGGFGWLGWFVPVLLLVLGGSLGDRLQAAHKDRVAGRIQLELARAALPQADAITVRPVEQAKITAGTTGPVAPVPTGADRTPRLVEEGDLRTSPEIVAALDRLVARVGTLVPPDDVAALRRIRDAAALALPPGDGPLDLTDHETWLIRQICTDYLPRAIEHYLALPKDLALEPVLDGRSARQVLDEQLALIEGRLREMAERAYRYQAGGLLNHARFVADSLRPDPFQQRLAELATAEPEAARIAETTDATVVGGQATERERDRA